MCGRYSLEATPQELVEAFALAEALSFAPRFNVAPTQPVPVVRADDTGERRMSVVRWGLTPTWWKQPRPLINARSETLDRKFQRAFHRRRCLVPATGFYEWQKLDGAKQPFHIQRHDRGIFAFAGIWDRYDDDRGGTLDACAIVTTAPNVTLLGCAEQIPIPLAPFCAPTRGSCSILSRSIDITCTKACCVARAPFIRGGPCLTSSAKYSHGGS